MKSTAQMPLACSVGMKDASPSMRETARRGKTTTIGIFEPSIKEANDNHIAYRVGEGNGGTILDLDHSFQLPVRSMLL